MRHRVMPEPGTRRREPVRVVLGEDAYYVLAWETALRPATLDALEAPGDYQPGAAYLRIRNEVDKARFGRELPLSAEARVVLDAVCPASGPIFGKHQSRARHFAEAVAASGVGEGKPGNVTPYDLRHARLTDLTGDGAELTGVSYLAGHKHLSTTSMYLKGSLKAAERALRVAHGGARESHTSAPAGASQPDSSDLGPAQAGSPEAHPLARVGDFGDVGDVRMDVATKREPRGASRLAQRWRSGASEPTRGSRNPLVREGDSNPRVFRQRNLNGAPGPHASAVSIG